MPTFLGLDVGTQGARALACILDDDRSRPPRVIRAAHPFPPATNVGNLPAGHVEQQPGGWWQAATACLRRVTAQVRPETIRALSVTSTSGTLCMLDGRGQPLLAALMYNDARAGQEAVEVQAAGAELAERLGYRFNASFALAKLLWLAHHHPTLLAEARYIVHAADFLTGRLCGVYDVTDASNALKTGYDVDRNGWPAFIAAGLGLPADKLPRVVTPGTVIGAVTPAAAEQTGLAAGTVVVAGMTDGCAAQIAAGAVAPGDWNSTLGTTLVLKGVTAQLIRDPQGRIYSHRHPDGYWLPGGASNVGGEILEQRYPGANLAALDQHAARLSPGAWVAYPLARRGERFPFVRPDAEGFLVPLAPVTPPSPGLSSLASRPDPSRAAPARRQSGDRHEQPDPSHAALAGRQSGDRHERQNPASPSLPSEEEIYTAYLEGVGYVERLAYETLKSLGADTGDVIHVAGGAARSDVWLQIRADILQRELQRPAEPGAAMGAAILAASLTYFDGLIPATRAMVQIERVVAPHAGRAGAYDERYERFRAECVGAGYIQTAQ